jgi:hypothetical protein
MLGQIRSLNLQKKISISAIDLREVVNPYLLGQ